jgi:hypothetical protein
MLRSKYGQWFDSLSPLIILAKKRLPIEIKVNSLLLIVKLVPIEQNQFQEHINVVLFAVDIARKL